MAFNNQSSGNQAYVALALLRAAKVAGDNGQPDRADDYLRTAKELLLYVGLNRARGGALGGFVLSENPAVGQARATEHNIDLGAAFDRAAEVEDDSKLKARWESWRDQADSFRGLMYGGNPRFGTLDWIYDDWLYFRAGTGLADDVNVDLIPIDTGAWSSLARDDHRGVALSLLGMSATSTDADGRVYTGFDPGFRAVLDESLTSRRDGVGAEATAYMALVARIRGDAAIVADLPNRAVLTPDEQSAYDRLTAADTLGASADNGQIADLILGWLGDMQLRAPNLGHHRPQAAGHLAHRARTRAGHVDVAAQLQEVVVVHVRHGAFVEGVDVELAVQAGPHGLDDVGGVVRAEGGHVLGDRGLAGDEAVHLPPHLRVPFVARGGLPERQRGNRLGRGAQPLPEADVLLGVGHADGHLAEDVV